MSQNFPTEGINLYALEKSIFIEEKEGLELWILGNNDFNIFNEFIFQVYSEVFGENGILPFTYADIEYQSTLYFNRTKVCGIKHPNGTLLGTWGIILKNIEKDDFLLPIEDTFNLSTENILKVFNVNTIQYIFYGWRAAIDKKAMEKLNIPKQKSIFIFDFLLRGLIQGFSNETEKYLGVSELEMLVLKYHKRVGIPWIILGEPNLRWGRYRYPCGFQLALFEKYLIQNHPDRYKFMYEK